jgi:predicted nucleic acid-binding protein
MKALDTPALLALLEGNPRMLAQLKKWREEEIATTEANLLELSALASVGSVRGRSERIRAIDRLRRRLTVLPIDARGGEEATRRAARLSRPVHPLVLGMLAALENNGCDELLTDDPAQFEGRWRFRVTKLGK